METIIKTRIIGLTPSTPVDSSPSLGGNPNLLSWKLSSQLWIDTTTITIDEGVCTNSGISVFTGTGSALGGTTNNSVDVAID